MSTSVENTAGHPIEPVRPDLGGMGRRLAGSAYRERIFLAFIAMAFLLVGVTYQHAEIARWIGFLFAAYAAVANDSIQTIGTFISSNRKQPWWLMWVFMAGIFVVTMVYSWVSYDGDVTYQRLASKGFEMTPSSFSYLQIAAPIFLLVLTRLRMPVSTTFLLLTSFSTSAPTIGKVLSKSLLGYVVAFGAAFALWILMSKLIDRLCKGEAHPAWRIAQWITSGTLWAVWLMQDASNIAVYLPRSLGVGELLAFLAVIVVGLGLLFRSRGERIQEVVEEKSKVVDVRAATIIDLVYAGVLYYFKIHSKIPMSTTWVFIGLLAGREIAMSLRGSSVFGMRGTLKMVGKDVGAVAIGLFVSLVIAMSVNDAFRDAVKGMLGL